MKKTLLLLIATLFLTACSSDDNNRTSSNSIVGKWKIMEWIFTNSDGTTFSGVANECEQNGRITFLENGTFTRTAFYELQNECLEVDEEVAPYPWGVVGNWEVINNNTLRLSFMDDSADYLITENTSNSLRIETDYFNDYDSISLYVLVLEKVN